MERRGGFFLPYSVLLSAAAEGKNKIGHHSSFSAIHCGRPSRLREGQGADLRRFLVLPRERETNTSAVPLRREPGVGRRKTMPIVCMTSCRDDADDFLTGLGPHTEELGRPDTLHPLGLQDVRVKSIAQHSGREIEYPQADAAGLVCILSHKERNFSSRSCLG